MNKKSITGYHISLNDALKQGGFYGTDGTWNSLLKIDGRILRGRVETLVIKKDLQQVFMHIKNYNKCLYRIPGGSFENGLPNIRQAENEVNEEAKIEIKNITNTGVHYIRIYNHYIKSSIDQLDWEGNYNEVYVAEYDGNYTGHIDSKDLDNDMYKYGKFYDLNYVYPILTEPHKQIIDSIFSTIKESEISESVIVLRESDNNVHFYPYYTPKEMNELGVFNETENRYSDIDDEAIDWYHEYTDMLYNTDSESWYKELQYRYDNYIKEQSLENKQLILNLGWNPEIHPTLENVLRASKITESKLKKNDDNINTIEESMIFDKKDIVLNLDDWDKGKLNILFITGLSGAGKSTLSDEIADEYNAEIIRLDYFQNYALLSLSDIDYNNSEYITLKYIDKYMKLHPEVKSKCNKFSSIHLEEFKKYFIPFFVWLVKTLEKDKKNKYIIEGIHILLFVPYNDIKGYPLYCINTSMTKSLVRHWIRDDWSTRDIIKHGYKDIAAFKQWNDSYNTFKDDINIEEAAAYNEVILPFSKNLKYLKNNLDNTVKDIENTMYLTSFSRVSINRDNLNKIKNEYGDLEEFNNNKSRWIDECSGFIFLDKNKFVALVTVSDKEKTILNIHISEEYMYYNLYSQLVEVAVIDLLANGVYSSTDGNDYKVYKYNGFEYSHKVGDNIIYMKRSKCDNPPKDFKCPIFIVNSYQGKFHSKVIATHTHSIWSHSSISMDSKLDNIFSFGSKGFTIEKLKDSYKNKTPSSIIEVLCVFVDRIQYSTINKEITSYRMRSSSTTYDYSNIIAKTINKSIQTPDEMKVCSSFVANIFKKAGVEIIDDDIDINNITPASLSDLQRTKLVHRVWYGIADNYDHKLVNQRIDNLKRILK